MKMKAVLVSYFLIAEVFFVLADQKVDSKVSDVKNLEDLKHDVDLPSDEKLTDAQRKRDPGYYYSKPNRFPSGSHHAFGRQSYRGRIVTKIQSQINRPFKQYGPPNQDGSSSNHEHNQPATDNIVNQEVPSPIRWADFVEHSPIASQNNQPFGQNTANYLPPKNQKLPAPATPYLFSNQNHDFPRHHQQQQQQQQQNFQEQQQQFQQLQIDNQNIGQDFNNQNQNFQQNEFTNQQISDAALFLSQNSQAISELYGAPAPNQNYAPNNQENEQVDQHLQQNQNLQASVNNQQQGFKGQLPSYASGILNTQETLQKIQSLEKDRIIAQLQEALSSRETAGRFAQDIDNISNFPQSESLVTTTSQLPPVNRPPKYSSGFQQGTTLIPTSTLSSLGVYQGFYGPSTPTTTTINTPISSTPTTTTTTILQPSHGTSGAGSTQIGTSLPAPGSSKPATVKPGFPQCGEFIPTFSGFIPSIPSVPSIPSLPSIPSVPNIPSIPSIPAVPAVPSIPTFGAVFPTTPLRPAENSPTHFAIPLPSFQGQKPVHRPPTTTPATTKPPINAPSYPNTPTFSIPLGPVHPPVQTPVIRPNPVPIYPAETPVHPTYGIHSAVLNPGFVYKPVKVLPVYYYPNIAYQQLQKPVGVAASTHPWSYAQSFTHVKPAQIWK